MNLQEAFNIVYRKFVIEKATPSFEYGQNPGCRYTWKGNHCAIGWLLPESIKNWIGYTSYYNEAVVDTIMCIKEISETFEDIDLECLYELQKCHDNSASFNRDREEYWFHKDIETSLNDFAIKHKLEIVEQVS